MSADDLGHRARPRRGFPERHTLAAGGGIPGATPGTDADPVADSVAATVPPEYRQAYLEGLARGRAERAVTAA